MQILTQFFFKLGIIFGQVLLGGENSVGVQLYKKVFAIASTSFGREVVKFPYMIITLYNYPLNYIPACILILKSSR